MISLSRTSGCAATSQWAGVGDSGVTVGPVGASGVVVAAVGDSAITVEPVEH